MADTTTTTYSLTKPEIGASEDSWGTKLNNNLDSIDDLLDGTTAVTGIDINSGTIDNAVIGGTTPAAGTFTTANATTLQIGGTSITATAAELNYTDGVTSNIQTQLDAKAPTASPTFTGSSFTAENNSTDGFNAYFTGGTGAGADSYLRVQIQNNTGTTALWFGDSDLSAPGRVQYEHDGDFMRFYTNNAEEMRLESDGDLHVDGDVIAYSTTISDERLKEDVKVVESALDKVHQLRGVTFKYKTDGQVSAGVIAQDVEKVLPEAVTEKEIPLKQNDGEAYKTVRYDALHALLIEAIKELSDEVAKLKGNK
jgi:hypothetical protein